MVPPSHPFSHHDASRQEPNKWAPQSRTWSCKNYELTKPPSKLLSFWYFTIETENGLMQPQRLRCFMDTIKHSNSCMVGSPRVEWKAEKITHKKFERLTSEKPLNLMKNINVHIQYDQRIPGWTIPKRSTSGDLGKDTGNIWKQWQKDDSAHTRGWNETNSSLLIRNDGHRRTKEKVCQMTLCPVVNGQ